MVHRVIVAYCLNGLVHCIDRACGSDAFSLMLITKSDFGDQHGSITSRLDAIFAVSPGVCQKSKVNFQLLGC